MQETTIKYKKTRIAPTPSGFLHLGNVMSFAITAALAKKTGAKTLLRIDDLDRIRVNKLFVQDIFDTLNFLEIPWDEGPLNTRDFEENYSQVHRMDLYKKSLAQLAEDKLVFACDCSRMQLLNKGSCTCMERKISFSTANTNWRLITKDHDMLEVKRYNNVIVKTRLPLTMQNFIIKKKDGLPAYQLTSVIDDIFYNVDLITRGEDLWSSTLAQHQLSIALKKDHFKDIAFYHHPLLKEISGTKLSKSSGATSIKYLRENGKSPSNIYKLIAAMIGINEIVSNWQQLADLILKQGV